MARPTLLVTVTITVTITVTEGPPQLWVHVRGSLETSVLLLFAGALPSSWVSQTVKLGCCEISGPLL